METRLIIGYALVLVLIISLAAIARHFRRKRRRALRRRWSYYG